MLLQIAGITTEDLANSPLGVSTTIFLQGCNIQPHCKGCQNANTWDITKGAAVTDEEILQRILDDKISTNVVFSGGEPTYQFEELLPLVDTLDKRGYPLTLYTGHTNEELRSWAERDPKFDHFLRYFTIVVSGPFDMGLRDTELAFRGSSNQKIMQRVSKDPLQWEDVSAKWDNNEIDFELI